MPTPFPAKDHEQHSPPPEMPAHPATHTPLPSRDEWLTWDSMLAALPHVHQAILRIEHELGSLLPKADMGQVVSLSTIAPGKPIEKFGRRYYRLLLSASASVVFDTPTGSMTLSLVAGWNVINLPEGTLMTLTTGNAVNVYALASDHING